jgi:hypothetical protein
MSMSTHVVGFRPPDAKWREMKKIWDACEAGGIDIPDKVLEFFQHETPDEAGVEVEQDELENLGVVKEWCDEGCQGFEVDVTKLPKDLHILRFYNGF